MLGRLALLWFQLRQKKCQRCGLPLSDSLDACPHCSHLSDSELRQFKKENRIDYDENQSIVPFLIFAGIIIAIIFILSTLVK